MRLGWSFFLVCAACSKLTSPPAPEPIASDTPVTMASASAVPHTVMTAPQQQHDPPPPVGGQELKIDDIVVGKGAEVKPGDTVSVHYTGTLLDGTKFDSSHDHPGNQPMVTPIPGRLIQGWNKGIPGMHVGGKRKLTVPPALGYGPKGQGKIPPNSTLVFEIELLEIKASGPQPPMPKAP
jgi:FKBP-type peptidyl-prolyl cis-trans isomerase